MASADGTTSTVQVTVNGTNDAAVVSSATVSLPEANAPLTTSGTLMVADVDDPLTFVAQSNVAGANGSFSIAANGAWTYVASSAFDTLNVGPTHLSEQTRIVKRQHECVLPGRTFLEAHLDADLVADAGRAFPAAEPARGAGRLGDARPDVLDRGAKPTAEDEIVAANSDKAAQARAKPAMIGWFVGQVMRASGGRANPQAVNDLVKAKLGI